MFWLEDSFWGLKNESIFEMLMRMNGGKIKDVRPMQERLRGIKKLGYNWEDKGVGKIARIVLKLFATEGEWEEYWRKRWT